MFESIISRPAPPPPASFVFGYTLVEKRKVLLKASTVLNKVAPPLAKSSNSNKSTETPSLGTQRKLSSKLSPQQNKTSRNHHQTSLPPRVIVNIGMNIVFWNCQGLRPKRKELQNYLLGNQIDILALSETFLEPKLKFQSGEKVILATIYCPNGNPSSRLFRMINALLHQVIFLGDFNSKYKNSDVSSQTNLVKRLLT